MKNPITMFIDYLTRETKPDQYICMNCGNTYADHSCD